MIRHCQDCHEGTGMVCEDRFCQVRFRKGNYRERRLHQYFVHELPKGDDCCKSEGSSFNVFLSIFCFGYREAGVTMRSLLMQVLVGSEVWWFENIVKFLFGTQDNSIFLVVVASNICG